MVDSEEYEATAAFIKRRLQEYKQKFPQLLQDLTDPGHATIFLMNEQVRWRSLRWAQNKPFKELTSGIRDWFKKRYHDIDNPTYAVADTQFSELMFALQIDHHRSGPEFSCGNLHAQLSGLFQSLRDVGATLEEYRQWLYDNKRLSFRGAVNESLRQSFCVQFKTPDLGCRPDDCSVY